MKKVVSISLVALLLLSTSCKKRIEKQKSDAIARVGNEYLYKSDLKDLYPGYTSTIDSITIAKNFINRWVKTQLILEKADVVLSDEQKNVSRQIEDYRNSLLVFKYEQHYLGENMDTVVTEDEIESYYIDNQDNFILQNNIMKAFLVKVPFGKGVADTIRYLYHVYHPSHMEILREICTRNNCMIDSLDNKWYADNELVTKLPKSEPDFELVLPEKKYYEFKADNHFYFLNVYEHKLNGEVSPLEMVETNIRNIILNKRKVKLLDELHGTIYRDAIAKGSFNIYTE